MRFEECSFGSIRIDGVTYDHDVVIDRGEARNERRSHPRSSARPMDIRRCGGGGNPRNCRRLVMGHRDGNLASHG